MKIAVLSLTRDRLDYTQHCFASLRENAGCDFDHYVWDNGSTDGTAEWLHEQTTFHALTTAGANNGISVAMNQLLRIAEREAQPPFDPYDVIVKVDNDCELLTPNTLRDIAELVDTYGLLLSPRILGLRQPPATLGTPLSLGGTLVDEKAQIGGIFLAAPADLYDTFRYSETNPTWGNDDVEICAHWRTQGGRCGYVQGYEAMHHETTDGQHTRYPDYFARTIAEGKAVL